MAVEILIVEDDPAILELLRINLQHAGYEVHLAKNAKEAHEKLRHQLPALIILDWMLPDSSGIHLARFLRQTSRTRDIPLIMLTARSAEQDKIQGLEAGADDYLTKPFSSAELIARIRALLRRRAPQLTDNEVHFHELTLTPALQQVTVKHNDQEIKLDIGPTEYRLLHFFMTHPDRIYSRVQLLDKVWGDHVFVEERTVDVHIKRLRAILIPVDYAKYIETIRGSGYRLNSKIEALA